MAAEEGWLTLSAGELDRLTARCREIPMTSGGYLDDDFVVALMNTVLDYQQRSATVERALAHFREHRWAEIRTLGELEACFARFPDDREGNEALATHLWGYRLWTRAGQLRVLVEYFDRRGVDTLDGLRAWALLPSFEDFRGQV